MYVEQIENGQAVKEAMLRWYIHVKCRDDGTWAKGAALPGREKERDQRGGVWTVGHRSEGRSVFFKVYGESTVATPDVKAKRRGYCVTKTTQSLNCYTYMFYVPYESGTLH